MKCPVDGSDLNMTERAGVEIDYCPQCRGVWLDRGELDKIIERSADQMAPPPPEETAPPPRAHVEDWHGHHAPPRKRKKRESFLSELFDF